MWTLKMVGLGALALSLSLEVLCRLFHRLRPVKALNEVHFFPSEVACVERIFTPSSTHLCSCPLPHGVDTSFSRLLRHVLSASSSMDLCIFSFSNMDLCRAVLALHRRGVTIRVLTDKDYAAITGSQIGALRKAGICVRCSVGSGYMHHKFTVLDGRLLITGSLNWTLSAVQGNAENVVVTDQPELVQPFMKEFHRLWELNEPAGNVSTRANHR
ncbi:mitochondrial cardiolipin hydrolase [Gouania willdenowi]|uniref:Mitochondrial cardiolipin hydrolase n=1 Tax=Gouania willdenowi TaxID=441366 RepID=A0A8C5ESM7_GOUWI|nr:mitochondrial cardiolipin hydrolase [Gouania willdenowi]XP_028314195.1 mitochondrial cardiolipin hydrolase [Gouania willdenowi]